MLYIPFCFSFLSVSDVLFRIDCTILINAPCSLLSSH